VPIKSLTFTASTKKLCAKLLYKKAVHKMLVKLTPEIKQKHFIGSILLEISWSFDKSVSQELFYEDLMLFWVKANVSAI
jgi:hypothetical protein